MEDKNHYIANILIYCAVRIQTEHNFFLAPLKLFAMICALVVYRNLRTRARMRDVACAAESLSGV